MGDGRIRKDLGYGEPWQTGIGPHRATRKDVLARDAPLFIDGPFVERFFDAVVRPKYEHVGETEQQSKEEEDKILAELGLKGAAGLKLPEWLKPIKIDVEAKGDVSGEQKKIARQAHARSS